MRKTNPQIDQLTVDNSHLLRQHSKAGNDESASARISLDAHLQETLESGSTEVHFEQDVEVCRIRRRVNGRLNESRIDSTTLVADLITEVQQLSNGRIAGSSLSGEDYGEVTLTIYINKIANHLECTYYPTSCGHNLTVNVTGKNSLPESLEQTTLSGTQVQQLRDYFLTSDKGLTLICSSNTKLLQQIYYGLMGESNCVEDRIVSIEHSCTKKIPRINQLNLASIDQPGNITRLATKQADRIYIDWRSAKNKTLFTDILENYQQAVVFLEAPNTDEAISRLTDGTINERQLATNLAGIIHLEDIRMVCPHCANSHELNGADMKWLESRSLGKNTKNVFVYAPGCERCDYSGSDASKTLLSICEGNDNLRSAIEDRGSAAIKKATAKALGQNAITTQVETLVAKGKVSFTEYKEK